MGGFVSKRKQEAKKKKNVRLAVESSLKRPIATGAD